MDILTRNKTILFYFLYCIAVSCNSNDKIKNATSNENQQINIHKQFVISHFGKGLYDTLYNSLNDSIRVWKKNKLKSWYGDTTKAEGVIDSVFAINKAINKSIFISLNRNLTNGELDALGYIYGVKIKNKWYFFQGPTQFIYRNKDSLKMKIPTSFSQLHSYAMKSIFNRYLKRKNNQWEINDDIFKGFAPKNNPNAIGDGPKGGYGSCFTCKTEEEYYLYLVNENWKDRDIRTEAERKTDDIKAERAIERSRELQKEFEQDLFNGHQKLDLESINPNNPLVCLLFNLLVLIFFIKRSQSNFIGLEIREGYRITYLFLILSTFFFVLGFLVHNDNIDIDSFIMDLIGIILFIIFLISLIVAIYKNRNKHRPSGEFKKSE